LESTVQAIRIFVTVIVISTMTDVGFAVDETNSAPSATQSETQQDESSYPEQFWEEARNEIFQDIELTPAQESGIEAILEEAAAGRASYAELRERLARARQEGNQQLEKTLSDELIQIRDTFRPTGRMIKMGDLLDDEQRVIFERNMRLRDDRALAERRAKQKAARERQPQPEPEDENRADASFLE
jgi:hypothetical protein